MLFSCSAKTPPGALTLARLDMQQSPESAAVQTTSSTPEHVREKKDRQAAELADFLETTEAKRSAASLDRNASAPTFQRLSIASLPFTQPMASSTGTPRTEHKGLERPPGSPPMKRRLKTSKEAVKAAEGPLVTAVVTQLAIVTRDVLAPPTADLEAARRAAARKLSSKRSNANHPSPAVDGKSSSSLAEPRKPPESPSSVMSLNVGCAPLQADMDAERSRPVAKPQLPKPARFPVERLHTKPPESPQRERRVPFLNAPKGLRSSLSFARKPMMPDARAPARSAAEL